MRLTTRPSAPVCAVTSVAPSICSAKDLHLGARLGEAHAALLARRSFLELALAAAAGVDLRLDHEQRPGKLLRRLAGLTHREGNHAVRCRDAELAQQFLGLMLVDVHAVLLFGGAVASSPA